MRGVHAFSVSGVAKAMREETSLQAQLCAAQEELSTALTILCSNADLIRIHLSRDPDAAARVGIDAHLSEMDLALERLRRLATSLRARPDAAKPIQAVEAHDVRTYIPVNTP